MSTNAFAAALERSTEPAVVPSLQYTALQKRILDSIHTGGLVCNYPLCKIKSKIRMIHRINRNAHTSQLLNHVTKLDFSSSKCTKLPGFRNIEDTKDPKEINKVLDDLISRETEVNLLLTTLKTTYQALKYVKYILIEDYPCQAKCVPLGRLSEYIKATVDPLGLNFVSVKNNEKSSFTQVNSMKHYSTNGLETIDCMPLEFSRIYALSENHLGYLHYRVLKLVSNAKHPIIQEVLYDPIFNQKIKDKYQGMTLCTNNRTCYNYGIMTNISDISSSVINLACGSCEHRSGYHLKTCYESFVDQYFQSDSDVFLSKDEHHALVAKIHRLLPVMKTLLCTGCFIYLTCWDHHHDHDIIYTYLQTYALPQLTAKTGEIPYNSDSLFPPLL